MYSSLRVVTPPAAEPVELDLVKRHCRVDSDYDDDLLTLYAITARQWAESYLNRALIEQELLFSMTSAPPPAAWPLIPQSLAWFPLTWPTVVTRPIKLPRARCTAVSEVYWGPVDDLALADPAHYVVDLAVEPATIALNQPLLPAAGLPGMSMTVQFSCGYGDADDVPPPIKTAIMMMTAFLYEGRGDVNSEMPAAPWNLLTPFRLWQFAG